MKPISTVSALLLLCLTAHGGAAQTKDPAAAETVAWTVETKPADAVKPASGVTLILHAQVRDGWHVYGLKQLPSGPTPLRVSLEPNAIAAASGEPIGSPSVKIHDPSFDLDTQLYSHAFSVTVPARIAARPAPGRQLIPLSVRFQTCNDRICQPPKTVHLSASIAIKERLMKTLLHAASLIAVLGSSGMAIAADSSPASIDGRWDAVLSRDGVDIPFRLDIKGTGPALKGVFYDGFKPYDGTTSAGFQDGKLELNIEHYLSTISATLAHGELTGTLATKGRGPSGQYSFEATHHVDASSSHAPAPSVAGSWVIPLEAPSSKGEKAFRLVVQQRGPEVAAAILRIDGDTGSYSGAYQDGKWVLSHFDGGRPGMIVVTPKPDGTLEIQQHVEAHGAANAAPDGGRAAVLTAYRADAALAKGLPAPDDFLTHTTARDPDAAFKFAFPDMEGKLVTNDDPRFKGKVVLAVVSGTWCPNCHDEAQYLVELDKKYRDKGLAIVDFDFEEADQQGSLERERAFNKQYGVTYTSLLAGAPSEMHEKVPQLNNLDTWPATIFIGRDGKVKAVHAGFASPASGKFYGELKQEFTNRIEQLLAEKASSDTTAANHAELTTRHGGKKS